MMLRLRLLGVLCAAAILTSAGTIVWSNTENHKQSCDNRMAIVRAFGAYTDALVGAGAGEERTPQEQQERDKAIEAFREDVARKLAPLRTGCE